MTKEEISFQMEEAFKIADKFYSKSFERPKTVIFKRSGTCGGYANWGTQEIMFQLDFAENVGVEYIQTIKHEVAHYIQDQLYKGSKAHGREWKFIMRYVMGLAPDRCHHYDTSVTKSKTQTRHTYGCGCGKTFKLSTTMHNRIQKGLTSSNPIDEVRTRRRCKSCRGILQLIKKGNPLEDKMAQLLKQLAS